jgi:hypothetical protein
VLATRDVDYTIYITFIMYQQLWGYKVEEKLCLGVREQKKLNTTALNYAFPIPFYILLLLLLLLFLFNCISLEEAYTMNLRRNGFT